MGDQPLSILLVEDAPVNRELAEIVLTRAGHSVQSVETGQAALEALGAHEYDALALDIRLPDIDGLEIARKLRADPKTHDMPIVAITALAMKGDREAALEAGCDGYITKPVNTRTLAKDVAKIIAEAQKSKNEK